MPIEQSNTISLPLTGLPLMGIPSFTPVWIPVDFPYLNVFLHGRPAHDRDEFSYRHPQMDHGKRAKIFAPFDALDGYSDAVKSKDVEYVRKIDLTVNGLADEERNELDQRLKILHRLTWNGRLTRENLVRVRMTYFVPCADENSFSYGVMGLYKTVTGVCQGVDPVGQTITVAKTVIHFCDVLRIDSEDGIFDPERKTEEP